MIMKTGSIRSVLSPMWDAEGVAMTSKFTGVDGVEMFGSMIHTGIWYAPGEVCTSPSVCVCLCLHANSCVVSELL